LSYKLNVGHIHRSLKFLVITIQQESACGREAHCPASVGVFRDPGFGFEKAASKSSRHFPPAWQVEQIPRGYKVLDANGQALVYARETPQQVEAAKVLTFDEVRRNFID